MFNWKGVLFDIGLVIITAWVTAALTKKWMEDTFKNEIKYRDEKNIPLLVDGIPYAIIRLFEDGDWQHIVKGIARAVTRSKPAEDEEEETTCES